MRKRRKDPQGEGRQEGRGRPSSPVKVAGRGTCPAGSS